VTAARNRQSGHPGRHGLTIKIPHRRSKPWAEQSSLSRDKSYAIWAALLWTCLTAPRIIGAARWIDRLTRCPGPVAIVYLSEPLFDRHEFAVWAGGHVAAGQHAGKRVRRSLASSAATT
jgi:hypothetical protein